MSRFDLHTHTVYCDGKNTPRDMVLAAIEKGFSAIGFSAHAYTDFDERYCIAKDRVKDYLGDLYKIKEEFRDKIEVLVGFEADALGKKPEGEYEYLIGSCHYVFKNGVYYAVDLSLDETKRAINEGFSGDADAFAEAYFETLATVCRFSPQIIGHFDLITKFNDRERLIDTRSPRYIAAYQKAADTLLACGAAFEVNTGAIARGYRKSAYPSDEILGYLLKKGASFVLSGDAHSTEGLGFGFEIEKARLDRFGITPYDSTAFLKCK